MNLTNYAKLDSSNLIDCYISYINNLIIMIKTKTKLNKYSCEFKSQILLIIDNLDDNQNNELVKYVFKR